MPIGPTGNSLVCTHMHPFPEGGTRARESSAPRLRHAQLFGMSLRIQRVFMYKRDPRVPPPNGCMCICTSAAVRCTKETLTTGGAHVHPPSGNLAKYYNTADLYLRHAPRILFRASRGTYYISSGWNSRVGNVA